MTEKSVITIMLEIAGNERLPAKIRLEAATAVAPYMHPRFQAKPDIGDDMTLPRDYTLAEIDAMRVMVLEKMKLEYGLPQESISRSLIEDRLRTYMSAGITLADLRGGVVKEPDPFEEDIKC